MYTYFSTFERYAYGSTSVPEYKFNAVLALDSPITDIKQIQAIEDNANTQLKNPSKGFCVLTNLVKL